MKGTNIVAVNALRGLFERVVLPHAALFLFVASFLTFYGQLDRKQSGDTFATVYTAVAVVRDGSVRLDPYYSILQERAGEHPSQLERGPDGHLYSDFPIASSLFGVPAVGVLAVVGVSPENWGAHMEASMFSGALVAAGAVALFFVLLTRLTTRARAFLAAAILAWATPVWTITGQGLWQHGPLMLALVGALLAAVDRRPLIAGSCLASMVAIRPSSLVIAACLIPLVARPPSGLLRAVAGAVPPLAALAVYNQLAFGCPTCMGYDDDLRGDAGFNGSFLEGFSGNLVSPGRGIFVYAPVLLLTLAGVVLGRRRLLYACTAAGAAGQVALVSFWFEWWGGEAFGPRQLVDALPLFALLLVPVLDRWSSSPSFRGAFGVLALWSVGVQFLGAALWPGTHWYDTHAVREFATWWDPTDTELTAFFSDPGRLAGRGALMGLVVLAALAAALGAAAGASRLPRLLRGRPAAGVPSGRSF